MDAMEPSEIRRRVLRVLEQAKRNAAAHRAEADAARRAFEALLPAAAPLWQQAASVLRAEGYAFRVFTPSDSLRFASERSGGDFIEITLDTSRRPVALVGRTCVTRGHRVIDRETIVAEGDAVPGVDAEAIFRFLLGELEPLVER